MALPDDPRALPGWIRIMVFVALGLGLFFAFVGLTDSQPARSTPEGGGPPNQTGSAVSAPALAASGAIAAVAKKAREDLVAFGEGMIVAGIARGRLDQALPKEPEAQAEVCEALYGALASEEWSERWVALLVMYRYGEPDARVVERLIERSGDEEPRVRRLAVEVLANLRGAGEAALEVVRAALALGGLSPGLEAALLRAVARSGGGDADATAFETALASEHAEVRRAAAYGLARLELGALAIELLIRALGDSDGEVRMFAAMGLSRKGAEARAAVRPLVGLLDDGEEYVVGWAETALAKIGPESLPALREATEAGSRGVARSVVWVLRQLGSEEATGLLREILAHPDPAWRARAAVQLHAAGAPTDDVLPLFEAGIRNDEWDTEAKLVAVEGLARMGREAEPARAALEALLSHADPRIRQKATTTLAGLGDGKGG